MENNMRMYPQQADCVDRMGYTIPMGPGIQSNGIQLDNVSITDYDAQSNSSQPALQQTFPQYPPAVQPQIKLTWAMINQKNKPQSNSAGAASLVFVCGGMNLAWSIGINAATEFVITTHMRICWFIGAIIGAAVGAALTNRIKKRFLFFAAIVLVLLDGALNVALWHNYDAIMAARYIDGIANGLVFVPVLVLAGEQAVKIRRAMFASSLYVSCCYLGIFVQVLCVGQWTAPMSQRFNELQIQGALTVIAGAIALLMTIIFYIESPIYFLLHNQDDMAVDSLRRLQEPFVVTQETYDQLEEHKRYVAENREFSFLQSAKAGLSALLKLCYLRGMSALSFSTMIYYGLVVTSKLPGGIHSSWIYIISGTLLYAGSVLCVYTLELTGCKKTIIVGAFICGGLALGIAIIFGDAHNLLSSSQMTIAMGLIFGYQFFSGFYTAASSAYLSEAFPLAVKPYYIAIPYIVEMAVEIVICCTSVNMQIITDYFFTLASLSFAMAVLGVVCLPETKETTLSEAQAKFRNIICMKIIFE